MDIAYRFYGAYPSLNINTILMDAVLTLNKSSYIIYSRNYCKNILLCPDAKTI